MFSTNSANHIQTTLRNLNMANTNSTHTPPTAADQKHVNELIAGGMSAAEAIKKVIKEATAGWLKLWKGGR